MVPIKRVKAMKTNFLFLVVFLFSIKMLFSQDSDASQPLLKSSDVENFIANIRSIEKEFKELEIDYSPQNNYEDVIQALESNADANRIVKKYGYSDSKEFVAKAWAITACYASIEIDTKGSPELDNALRKIDEDESLSPEEKEEAKEQVKQFMAAMGTIVASSANVQDIETVRPFISRLEKVLDVE
jgi:hypothetical protein